MNRHALAHVIRSVCAHTGLPEVVVLGSQAILGTADAGDLPVAATRSIEADIAVDPVRLMALDPAILGVDAEQAADEIDGAFGEYSQFHTTFGYYAQGVEVATAVLPDGWRDRLRPLVVDRPDGGTVVAWCLEVHDLWISKAAAGRQKDAEFCRALVRAGWVDRAVLDGRLSSLDPLHQGRTAAMLAATFRTIG